MGYPIIYRILYIPGGAGFLPSTVSWLEIPCSWHYFISSLHDSNLLERFCSVDLCFGPVTALTEARSGLERTDLMAAVHLMFTFSCSMSKAFSA